jgi:hypothetical protein
MKSPGVDLPDVAVVNEPTGVDMGGPQAVPPQDAVFDDAVFDTALDMVLIKKRLLKLWFKLNLPRLGWWHAMLAIGRSQRSMSQACKVTSNKLH